MTLWRAWKRSVVAGAIIVIACGERSAAQDSKADAKSTSAGNKGDAGLPVAGPGDQVVIKRDAVQPIDPQRYRISLYLTPLKSVTLVAPHDGTVRSLAAKLGESHSAQTDVVRLDNTVEKFRLQRAQHLYKAAVLEQKLAGDGGSSDQKELGQARVDAAKAELELAQYLSDQSNLRMPFAGEVLRYLVTDGQFVKAGEPVAIVGDTSTMQVEIPAERSQIEKEKTFPIKVEGSEVEARVQSVLPLDRKFDALRELFDALTSAVLVIDNAKRTYQPGQTVIVPLIPRHPVVEVSNGAIINRPEGGRKVQVLRDAIVRDIPVTIMGSVGSGRVFVNGPFAPGDEVIYETSHLLADGFPVRPSSGKTKKAGDDPKGDKPVPTGTGF